MTVKQIMSARVIISCAPHRVKAKAIKDTPENDLTPMVPATMLKRHPERYLFVDKHSAEDVEIEKFI